MYLLLLDSNKTLYLDYKTNILTSETTNRSSYFTVYLHLYLVSTNCWLKQLVYREGLRRSEIIRPLSSMTKDRYPRLRRSIWTSITVSERTEETTGLSNRAVWSGRLLIAYSAPSRESFGHHWRFDPNWNVCNDNVRSLKHNSHQMRGNRSFRCLCPVSRNTRLCNVLPVWLRSRASALSEDDRILSPD